MAGTSDATKYSSFPNPITAGGPFRAATILFGSPAEMTTLMALLDKVRDQLRGPEFGPLVARSAGAMAHSGPLTHPRPKGRAGATRRRARPKPEPEEIP